MKSEPEVFGIDDLHRRPRRTAPWDGVRNYQARNYLREMKKGDEVLFYHSSCDDVGIVGIARVVRQAYPDPTAFDPDDPHFDPKSKPDDPTWYMVDVRFVRKFKHTIGLDALKAKVELEGLPLIRRGNRLSVMPVSDDHWKVILDME